MAALVLPGPRWLGSYLDGCREYREHGVHTYTLHDSDAFDTWKDTIFETFACNRRGEGLRPGYVPCTILWLVEGETWLGMASLRHSLTPALERFGGHIGYAVRWSRWGEGFGTAILHGSLAEARKLDICSARVTCDEANTGSRRVIEKNGGVLLDIIDNTVDGVYHRTRRYDVPTGQPEQHP
ncbi:MAG: GNAT family N-acetyltransferase [Clostridiaceae bacterium]|nr:GNAT family N-acetyltransferase [Clostridiaceae bacterium]